MPRLRRLTVLTLALLAPVSGCDQWGNEYELRLELPRLPVAWGTASEVAAYELRWVVYGRAQHLRVEPEETNPAEGVVVSVRIPKRPNVAVLAYPVTCDGILLKPAGAIVPLQLRTGNRVRLRFERGPPAYLLYRLDRDGRGGAAVNAARLVEEFEERLGELRWWADWVAVLDAFERGVFRVTMLRAVAQHQVQLALPPGTYRSADLLAPPRYLPAAGPREQLLPEGVHRWFSDDGERFVTIQVGPGGTVSTVSVVRSRARLSRL